MELWTLENGVPRGEIGTFPTYSSLNRGAKAAETARNICAIYGDNAIEESMARKWFSHFKENCFHISDTQCSGRLLNTFIHNDPRQCARELANVMNCDHSTIVRHLHSMDKVKKIGCIGAACTNRESIWVRTNIYVRNFSSGPLCTFEYAGECLFFLETCANLL